MTPRQRKIAILLMMIIVMAWGVMGAKMYEKYDRKRKKALADEILTKAKERKRKYGNYISDEETAKSVQEYLNEKKLKEARLKDYEDEENENK